MSWWFSQFGRERPKAVELTLYSRPGCHLCDEMKSEIARAGLGPDFKVLEVNIETDARLEEQYGQSIPVLAIGGRALFKGRLSAAELRRKLERRIGR